MSDKKPTLKPAKITEKNHEYLVKAKAEYEYKKGKKISFFQLMEDFAKIAYPIWRKDKDLE